MVSQDKNVVMTNKMPDTYLILMVVAILAFLLTYLVTPGSFEYIDQSQAGEIQKIIDPSSFKLSDDGPVGTPVFATNNKVGLLNLPFEGMVAGDRWGSTIGVFAFIIITGGSFGLLMATGAIDRGLLRMIDRSQSVKILAVPVLFLVFSLGGAVFGMGEEVIPFVLIVTPLFIAMGYDSVTALLVTYVATQIGFACSWMNPFSLSIAQSIAGVPLMSGAGFRMAVWFIFTLVGIIFTIMYAMSVKENPKSSKSYQSDKAFRDEVSLDINANPLKLSDWLIISLLIVSILWIIWGVTSQGYYLPEIATQFFSLGLLAGIIGCIFKMNNMTANSAVEAFKNGASQLLPAAMIVAFAKGIVLILGGDSASSPSVLNTVLYHASQLIDGLPEVVAAWFMLFFQSIFNFFVTSGSGQAALTMPLMAPLGDLVGVSRQTSVLAFQLGDGLTNILVPTSAALMGCLGAAKLDWGIWVKVIALPICILFLLASGVMLVAVMTNF